VVGNPPLGVVLETADLHLMADRVIVDWIVDERHFRRFVRIGP